MSECLGRVPRSTTWLVWCLCLAAVASDIGHAADTPGVATQTGGTASTAVRQCQFIDGTLVPQLVIGVRRLNDGTIDSLAVRAEHDPDGATVAEARLFRPYYVIDRRTDAMRDEWLLIQDGYTTTKPLGWVAARHVEPFRSRYAYTFASRDRDHPADLHDTSKDSYERLLAQMKGDPEAAKQRVLIEERDAETPWNPVTIEDVVPFIELRLPADVIEPEYPDTTPTHRFGITTENRLVHMGAICGGPMDVERLASLRKENQMQAGLEMVFVVDETESMQPFFSGVADFLESAGRAAAKQREAVKLAVSYYTDGPPGTRVSATPLREVKGEKASQELAGEMRTHPDKLPRGDYADPPERMLEGLRNSITTAGFTDGSDAFVAVIGDTGHEPANAVEKQKLIDEVATLIKKHSLHVFFAHVGRRKTESEMLFTKDAEAVREATRALGVPAERVVYQPANANTLSDEISKAQDRAAQVRRERLRQIERIASRTPYTTPGPKLLEQLAAAGVPRARFDDLHLQYYLPSSGWLFHPVSPVGNADAQPQFRELFFLAPPEQAAIRQVFTQVQEKLAKGESIDHEAAISTLATTLASASGNPTLEARTQSAWKRLPPQQRSLGVFLEDVFGLRLKTALPYPPEKLTKQPATADEIRLLGQRVGHLSRAFAEGGPSTVWFEASSLAP